MRIPFDIKYRDKIESGEYKVIYVENSSTEQYPVEILKWDSNSDAGCIIGCLRRNGKDRIYAFDENGEHKVSDEGNRLFIITSEPEMSEFENEMLRYLQDTANKKDDSEIVESTKEHSIKLLSIARNEFNKQIENDYREIIHGAYKRGKADAKQEVERRIQSHEKLMEILNKAHEEELEKAYKNSDEVQYRKGREDALKDLPRWRSVEADKIYDGCVARYMDVNGDWNYCLSSGKLSDDCQYISIADLEKLPKEDESHE